MAEGSRVTLQSRVTVFIIIFAILLVSAFTTIQIKNQLRTITDYNVYQARITALFLKTSLERITEKIPPDADASKFFGDSLSSFNKSNLIQTGTVIAKYDSIIASTDTMLVGKRTTPEEALKIKPLFDVKEKAKGVVADIDKASKTLFMYIPVKSQETVNYVMRAEFSLGNLQEALKQVYVPIIFTALIVVIGTIGFGFMLGKNIIGPIRILNEATKYIADGNLDMEVTLPTGDELEELAGTFNDMTIALKKMRDRAENANPLTKLPGNNVIREEVEKRIQANEKFVVVYADLDNFKAFNDKYGIHAGDKAIQMTSQIFQESIKAKGDAGDFIGHEGGDDFVIVTVPEKDDAITSQIIKDFDEKIRSLYTEEDLKAGCIVAKGRDGVVKKFPIMTISLSGVTNSHRKIDGYAEVTNIMAEVKKKTKAIEKSCYHLDKRTE